MEFCVAWQMDGFEANDGIIVMAATNMQESLDAALTRPGRFDRHVAVPLPDVRGRLEIIDYYLKVAHFFDVHCRCPCWAWQQVRATGGNGKSELTVH